MDNSNEYDIAVSLYSSYAAYYDAYENNFPKTENAFLKAINVGKKDNAPALKMNLLDVYKAFSDFYEKHNKLDKSVAYLKSYIDLNTEILTTRGWKIRSELLSSDLIYSINPNNRLIEIKSIFI